MSLTNCEINLDLNWSKTCDTVAPDIKNQATTFTITDTKIYVPVVTLWSQDNTKLLKQLKSGVDIDLKATQHINFTGTLNWAKGATKIFITEEANETVLHFAQATVKVF